MREILFRGQKFDTHEWIYGSLLEGDVIVTKGATEIDEDYIGFNDEWSSVLPSTVGQYTGIDDKDLMQIFEGDIVLILCDVDECGTIKWDEENAKFVVEGDGFEADFDSYYGYDLLVVDNIYGEEASDNG